MKMKNLKKMRQVKLLPLTLAAMLLLAACGTGKTELQETPELLKPVGVNLDTELVKRGDVINTVAYEGDVIPTTEELYFSVDGSVKKMLAYPGQYVEEGDALIELDQSAVLAQIESLEDQLQELDKSAEFENQIADLNIALREIEVQEARNKQGEGSAAYSLAMVELESAKLSKEQAEEKRELNQKSLESKLAGLRETASEQTLYAPCSGHFYCADTITEGSYVSAGRHVAYVVDPSRVKFMTNNESIPDRVLQSGTCYAWINGQRWEVHYEPLTNEEKITYIMAKKVPPTYFEITNNDGTITAGMNGAVIGISKSVTDVLYIPKNAVFYDAGGYFAYVITGGVNREKRYIETGFSNGILTEIVSGLEEGEEVYVEE